MTEQGLIVVKVGGDVLLDERERLGLGRNLRGLIDLGHPVVVVHGGGPQISRLQARLGLVATKVGGRRVTTPEDLVAVQQAVCGEVNVALTTTLLAAGVRAFGCHGASGAMVQARRRPPGVVPEGGPEPVDFGEVGDVVHVDAGLLRALLGLGLVPVIGTLGVTPEGERTFNVNADTSATRIAQALRADTLLLVTQVGGVFRDLSDPDSRFDVLDESEARALIEAGVIAGGMIPKVEEALTLLDEGIGAIAIVNAAEPDAFAQAVRPGGGGGTRLVRLRPGR